jgi:hypothetical protein
MPHFSSEYIQNLFNKANKYWNFWGVLKKYTYNKYNTVAESSKASNSVRPSLDILDKYIDISNNSK